MNNKKRLKELERRRRREAQRKELIAALEQGALAGGFATELWTLPRGVRRIAPNVAVENSITAMPSAISSSTMSPFSLLKPDPVRIA